MAIWLSYANKKLATLLALWYPRKSQEHIVYDIVSTRAAQRFLLGFALWLGKFGDVIGGKKEQALVISRAAKLSGSTILPMCSQPIKLQDVSDN